MINGIAMFIAVMLLATWIPAHWKRRVVGYGFLADVSVHVVLQGLFGGDSDGRIAMLFGGILINVAMHLYRALAGYEKLTTRGWQRYAGGMSKTPTPALKAKARKRGYKS